MAFLEERLSEKFSFGSAMSEVYSVDVLESRSGNKYRRLLHPYPTLVVDLDFSNRTDAFIYQEIVDIYQRSGGRFGGFRWRHPLDYSTFGLVGVPTHNDQLATVVIPGEVYQATKWYGPEGGTDSMRRRLLKLAGQPLVGIRDDFGNPHAVINPTSPAESWTVDVDTGLITFYPRERTITAISNAGSAAVTVGSGHGFSVGDTAHISGVGGMSGINGLRGQVQSIFATDVVLDIDSSGFGAYTSGGVANRGPQPTEQVTVGAEFDVPVSFASDLSGLAVITKNPSDVVMGVAIQLIELLNP